MDTNTLGVEVTYSATPTRLEWRKPVFIIAEVGSNHNGSLGKALALIDIAVAAKADAVKFQLIPPFQPSWVDILIEYCGRFGIEFMATPFSKEGIEALRGKVKHWKIASPEATDPDFVHAVLDAARMSTVLISDGASDSLDKYLPYTNVVPMACVVKYPADEGDYHFYHSGKWGLSDHTTSLFLPVMAVSHGATYIEKHFTDDSKQDGPDHHFALEPDKLKDFVAIIRLTEKVLANQKLTIKEEERHLQWP